MQTLRNTLIIILASTVLSLAAPSGSYPGAPSENEAQSEAAKAYQKAWNLYLAENYDQSEAAFRELLQKFAKSRWADDSEYWLCTILVKREGDTPQGFECYEALVKKYRNTRFRNDAEAQMITIGAALARQGLDQYAEKVAAMQEGQDEELILLAISALEDIGDEESLQAILELYRRSERVEVRERVARVLEDFSGEAATQALSEIVRSDSSHKVRQRALRSLGERGDKNVIPFLKEIASDASQPHENQAYAVRAIGELDARGEIAYLAQAAVQSQNEATGRAAVGALGRVSDDSGFNALRQVFEQAALQKTRRRALLEMGDEFEADKVAPFLKEIVLNHSDNEVRKTALAAIADMKHEIAFPFVRDIALNATNPVIRESAVRMLDEFQTDESMQTLAQILSQDRSHATRLRAARGLSEFEDPRSVEALKTAALNDAHTAVRRAAIRSLGEIGTPEAKRALVEILNRQ